MKRLKGIYVSLLMAAFVPGFAHADFLVEPNVGYGFETLNAKVKPVTGFPNGVDISAKGHEIVAGLKLGYRFPNRMWLAVDPQIGFSGRLKFNSTGEKTDSSRQQVFADLGYDATMVRIYAGYGFLNEFKMGDNKYSGGQALKLGLSVELFANVALNVEYRQQTYSKGKDENGTKFSVADFYDPFKETLIVAGLSFPFGLSGR